MGEDRDRRGGASEGRSRRHRCEPGPRRRVGSIDPDPYPAAHRTGDRPDGSRVQPRPADGGKADGRHADRPVRRPADRDRAPESACQRSGRGRRGQPRSDVGAVSLCQTRGSQGNPVPDPCIALGGLGFWLASPGGPLGATFAEPILWLYALGGSLLGLLIGGGVVWAVRILGSLAFGKEAMGLGDVHLMAGVGACLGWIDPVLAFFIAPFFGIGWTIASVAISRFAKREGSALPYGPHLAAATVLVLLAKPAIEAILGWIMGEPIDLP
ncbi:prepilin peptidase [Phycisphaerales bacterium ac7]